MKKKMFVTVEGGMVTAVHINWEEDVNVTVVDLDNGRVDIETEEQNSIHVNEIEHDPYTQVY